MPNSMNNVEAFAAMYLLHLLAVKVPPFHREMYKAANEGHRRLCITAPRSFAKSTVFSIIYPLYQICEGKMKKIMIMSETADLAKHWLRQIKSELENNEFILEDFGSMKTDKWSETQIICQNKSNGNKIEVRAKGCGSQIRGFRPDLIVFDDLENEDTVGSADQRDKVSEWFYGAAINTLEKDAQAIMIGTLLHPEALLRKVSENKTWKSMFFQAITKEGDSLWPEKWPIERLLERKAEIGDRLFAAEYQNKPIISENPIFYEGWFKSYDSASPEFTEVSRKGLYTVLALDPAISQRDRADYSAIVTLSSDYETDNIYVRRGGCVRHRLPTENTVNTLIRIYKQFNCKFAIIEATAFQRVIVDWLRRWERDSAENLTTRTVIPDRDKERRANFITPMLQQGKVFFDKSDPMICNLMSELCLFPTGTHDDLVDAFIYALTELKNWQTRRKNRIKGVHIVLPNNTRRNSVTGIMS